MGEDAERTMAMRCESWLASKNVSNLTTLNLSGRPPLWRPFLLSTRLLPRPFQAYPLRRQVRICKAAMTYGPDPDIPVLIAAKSEYAKLQ